MGLVNNETQMEPANSSLPPLQKKTVIRRNFGTENLSYTSNDDWYLSLLAASLL